MRRTDPSSGVRDATVARGTASQGRDRVDGGLRKGEFGGGSRLRTRATELEAPTVTLARRIGRLLERRGLLERDAENAWPAGDEHAEPDSIDTLRAASITCRVALGTHRPCPVRAPVAGCRLAYPDVSPASVAPYRVTTPNSTISSRVIGSISPGGAASSVK